MEKRYFYLSNKAQIFANPVLCTKTMREFWKNCAYRIGTFRFIPTDGLRFHIGESKTPNLGQNDYAIHVEPNGISAIAQNEKALIRAAVALAQSIEIENGELKIPCGAIEENPPIKRRMVHFCVFPETELYELDKFVRFCGALGYTHLVLEFWGMLRFDCLMELSWKHAFSKSQIRPIVKTANEFGIEIVPMFNHWGHASASRFIHGKHVTLDQNPSLQKYFTNEGWCWNYRNATVVQLLKKVRAELIDLCGEGEFFHIGCDEAYGFDFSREHMREFCDFVNGICNDLTKYNRRPIAWGDMFVAARNDFNPNNHYYVPSQSLETEKFFLSTLDKRIVVADWQYEATEYPVETSLIFKQAGFDVIVCPWDRSEHNCLSCVKTAKDGLFGVMHTTWHTLSYGYPYALLTAYAAQNKDTTDFRLKTAEVLRKAYFAKGNYKRAGWSKKQISDIT